MSNYISMLFFFMYFNIVSILQHAKIAIVFSELFAESMFQGAVHAMRS